MKLSAIIPLSSLLLAGVAFASSVHNGEGFDPNTGEVLTTEYVQARLDTIVIEDFNIQKVQLSKALAHLDALVEPHGIQILFRPNKSGADPEVNLMTRNMPLSRNLSFMSRQGGYDWWVDSGVIVVGVPESNEALVTEIFPIKKSAIIKNGPSLR